MIYDLPDSVIALCLEIKDITHSLIIGCLGKAVILAITCIIVLFIGIKFIPYNMILLLLVLSIIIACVANIMLSIIDMMKYKSLGDDLICEILSSLITNEGDKDDT